MKAFELKKSIETLLEQNANGKYAVISPQKRKNEAESLAKLPQITVFYSRGSFDKSKSGVNSPYHHDCSFNIHIRAASTATINLAVLQNPQAAQQQIAAALAEHENATLLVDEKIDSMISLLFDIIMRPQHRNLGTDYVTNRWITEIRKLNPEPLGAIVTAVATITLTAQTTEEVTGEEGTGENNTVETGVNI